MDTEQPAVDGEILEAGKGGGAEKDEGERKADMGSAEGEPSVSPERGRVLELPQQPLSVGGAGSPAAGAGVEGNPDDAGKAGRRITLKPEDDDVVLLAAAQAFGVILSRPIPTGTLLKPGQPKMRFLTAREAAPRAIEAGLMFAFAWRAALEERDAKKEDAK